MIVRVYEGSPHDQAASDLECRMDLAAIQQALRAHNLDGWLFYDHHYRDPIGYRILGLPTSMLVTRRWYYFIPAQGTPRKLVHRIEAGHLASLPGETQVYSSWEEQHARLRELVSGAQRVAMQYSPNNMIPYISLVDAGTVELLRSFGVNVITSADLVARFEATWSTEALASHREAGKVIDAAIRAAFKEVRRRLDASDVALNEYAIQQFLVTTMRQGGLVVEEPPIVAVNGNAGNPHYEPHAQGSALIRENDLLLLDVWGKCDRAGATYYDVTWMGYCGEKPPKPIHDAFELVRSARDAAISFVEHAVKAGQRLRGLEVDRVTRGVIEAAGRGAEFVHRTGHSIGESVHANGANMDDLETHDVREILPNTCFSIEPGIYTQDYGIRLEVDMYIHDDHAEVTTAIQHEMVRI